MMGKQKNIRLIRIFTIATLLLTACFSGDHRKAVNNPPGRAASAVGTAIHITDIHFNPFYDPSLIVQLRAAGADQWETIFESSRSKTVGGYHDKDETPYLLLKSTLQNIKSMINKADFIIFTGDFLAHNFSGRYRYHTAGNSGLARFINKTLSFLALMFDKYLPRIPVYICIGNNDSYHGDYQISPGGQFLQRSGRIYARYFIKKRLNRQRFLATYPAGGYYRISPPASSGNQLIALNSVLFSPRNHDPGAPRAAEEQLQWLQKCLQQARVGGRRIWFLMHIPPGKNVYRSLRRQRDIPFWHEKYQRKFKEIVTRYSSVIRAGFAGHTHMDDYRFFCKTSRDTTPAACSYIKISPAVSPEFGNNPAFSCITFNNADFTPLNYQVYYLNLARLQPEYDGELTWDLEYSLGQAYSIRALTPESIQLIHQKIGSRIAYRSKYLNFYDVSRGFSITQGNWRHYWRAIIY